VSQLDRYDLSVRIWPGTGRVGVDARVARVVAPGEEAVIRLAIHRSARISSLRARPELASWRLCPDSPVPYAPEASALELVPRRQLSSGQLVRFELAYELQLGVLEWGVNMVTPEWVEIGMYFPWFPLDVEYRRFEFAARVEVCEPGYSVGGNGRLTRHDGHWLLRGEQPDQDVVILAAPELVTVGADPVRVTYADRAHSGLVSGLMATGRWLLEWFGAWFGPAPGRHLQLVIAPREKGGGYARRSMVVMTPGGLAEPLAAFRWLAHEIAHLWWQRGDVTTWEDWLNESFAEYSSLLAVRERHGDTAADELLASLSHRAVNLPPVCGLDRRDDRAYRVLYAKGCVILHRLAELIGERAMMQMLRQANEREIASTAELLRLLAELAGPAAAELEAWLGL